MPLEIRELVIKATVGQTEENTNTKNSTDPNDLDVNLIVEKVLTILKEKAER